MCTDTKNYPKYGFTALEEFKVDTPANNDFFKVLNPNVMMIDKVYYDKKLPWLAQRVADRLDIRNVTSIFVN